MIQAMKLTREENINGRISLQSILLFQMGNYVYLLMEVNIIFLKVFVYNYCEGIDLIKGMMAGEVREVLV